MGRSWQFFFTIAVVATVMGYLYYSSDYYAQRAKGGPAKPAEAVEGAAVPTPSASEEGIIPSNE